MAKRKIKRKHSTRRGWAIETGLQSPRYVLNPEHTSPWFHGTRRRARESLALRKASDLLPDTARVVRVSVTVTTIGRG